LAFIEPGDSHFAESKVSDSRIRKPFCETLGGALQRETGIRREKPALGMKRGKYHGPSRSAFHVRVETMKSFRRVQAAFTLIEAMIAIGMFGIYAGVAMTALLRMNTNAALSRLQTGASTLAQNQIDLVLSDSPFNPKYGQIPPELTVGTTNTGTAAAPTLAVYTDPISGNKVLGWMTTVVADTGSTLSAGSNASGAALYIYRVTVTVSYNYRGKTRSVTMSTMRASDI
jgi:type II secretory pathway pseudopilin PulG